ncbi:hypothetical protein AB4851_28770 [Burkholderia sp. 22PA0099]|uniref:hypothetical protein n=1 Tax=Burkholderia sp. 22PA0099 TaxID=3237372 RepID=UPI0039C239B1
MFDLAENECRMGRGVACVILCAAAIEALFGDIALSLVARRDFVNSVRDSSQEAPNLFGQKQAAYTFSKIPPLNALEESIATAFGKLSEYKSSGLDLYYVLDGFLQGEDRNPKKATKAQKAAWKSTLPLGVGELFELRNSIVHRHGSAFIFDNEGALMNGPDALPPSLAELKDIFKIDITDSNRSGWLGLIDTEEVATWGVRVAREFINATLHSLPQTPAFDFLKSNAKI